MNFLSRGLQYQCLPLAHPAGEPGQRCAGRRSCQPVPSADRRQALAAMQLFSSLVCPDVINNYDVSSRHWRILQGEILVNFVQNEPSAECRQALSNLTCPGPAHVCSAWSARGGALCVEGRLTADPAASSVIDGSGSSLARCTPAALIVIFGCSRWLSRCTTLGWDCTLKGCHESHQ